MAERALRARARRPTTAAYAVVGEIELVRAANGSPFAEAVAVADRILAAGEVSPGRYAQAIATIYGNEAGRMRLGRRLARARPSPRRESPRLGAAKAPGDGSLAQLARNLRRNFVGGGAQPLRAALQLEGLCGREAAIKAALAAMPDDASLGGRPRDGRKKPSPVDEEYAFGGDRGRASPRRSLRWPSALRYTRSHDERRHGFQRFRSWASAAFPRRSSSPRTWATPSPTTWRTTSSSATTSTRARAIKAAWTARGSSRRPARASRSSSRPSHVHAGIVTCGGLCPGINDVIRAIVRCLWFRYGVRRITGIRYGYRGFLPEFNIGTRPLDPEAVDEVHKVGGTFLGSSRGGGDRVSDIVDSIERLNLNILFTIGGDGTQKGAVAIAEEIERRNLKIAVVGIPKTIDNDLRFVDRTFGFETAVARAAEAVTAAHVEAHSAMNGIGLVKLMGRESGFIAVHTVLAVHEANFVLIPEVPFEIDGPNGFLRHLEDRITRRSHAVVVVAEGAGQEFLKAEGGGRLGQPQARRHRRLPSRSDHRALQEEGHGRDGQVHRPELHGPLLARHPHRLGLLRAAGQQRRPRGDGGTHQGPHRHGPRPVRAHPRQGRGLQAELRRPRGRPLARRGRRHAAAARHDQPEIDMARKNVLIIDESDLFREYLKDRLDRGRPRTSRPR